jgi:hypothetical protein
MDIKVVALTGILELFCILVFIVIAKISKKCMLLLELLRWLNANSIGLFWKFFDANIWVKCFSIVHKFKNVAFLYLLLQLHILKLFFIRIHQINSQELQNIFLLILIYCLFSWTKFYYQKGIYLNFE